MDLIDRQALLKKLFPYEVVDLKCCAINAYAVKKAILDAPGEVEHGEWVFAEEDDNGMVAYRCSSCNQLRFGRTKYCSHCGAKMDIKGDDND